jgi:hypothetical protein
LTELSGPYGKPTCPDDEFEGEGLAGVRLACSSSGSPAPSGRLFIARPGPPEALERQVIRYSGEGASPPGWTETKRRTTMKKALSPFAALSDNQIVRKGDRAVHSRHDLAVVLLDCLVEIERRELYLKEGYPSLFAYCTDRWNYSPPKAGRTIAAARCVRAYPEVRTLLMEHRITVCGVSRIAGILTDENRAELLGQVAGRKYAEIDRIVAARRTAPALRERIRPIGVKTPRRAEGAARREGLFRRRPEAGASPDHPASSGDHSRIDSGNTAVNTHPAPPKPREERFEIRFSAGKNLVAMLEQAKAICSRRATIEAVLVKVLDEFLDKHDPERRRARREKRRAKEEKRGPQEAEGRAPDQRKIAADAQSAESGNPPGGRSRKRSRHIPAAIRDAVFARDGGRCTFIGRNSVRCSATTHLQIDHIEPFCRGGAHQLENLRLLCGKHNRLVARELELSP